MAALVWLTSNNFLYQLFTDAECRLGDLPETMDDKDA